MPGRESPDLQMGASLAHPQGPRRLQTHLAGAPEGKGAVGVREREWMWESSPEDYKTG